MSPVDRVRALWMAFESRGVLAALDHVHEECEWVPSPGFPDGKSMRGTRFIRAHLEQLLGDGVRIEPRLHSCEPAGDDVVVCGRMRVVSPTALSDSPLFWVYRLRDEQVVRVESYPSRRDALAAA